MFRPTPRLFLASVLATLIAVGGPTSSGAADAPSPPTTLVPIGTPSWLTEADVICTETNRLLMNALAGVERNRSTRKATDSVGNRTARPNDVVTYARVVAVPALTTMVAKLRTVSYPADRKADIVAVLDAYDAALAVLRKDPSLARRADALREPTVRLRELRFARTDGKGDVGFRACGSLNRKEFAPTPATGPTSQR